MSTGVHNASVIREISEVACRQVVESRDAWVHGFVVGVALSLGYPATAREVRAEIERIVARRGDIAPEEVEVYLRSITELFDRSLDTEAAA